jgi:hypothetical protein
MKRLLPLLLLTSCVPTQQPIPTCEAKITKQLEKCQVLDVQILEKKSPGTSLLIIAAMCDDPLRTVALYAIDARDNEVNNHLMKSGLAKDGQCTEQGILMNVFKAEESMTNKSLERAGI